jgi:hypothetical protein
MRVAFVALEKLIKYKKSSIYIRNMKLYLN